MNHEEILRGGCRFFVQEKTQDRETVLNEGDFVIIPPEMNQAVFTGGRMRLP